MQFINTSPENRYLLVWNRNLTVRMLLKNVTLLRLLDYFTFRLVSDRLFTFRVHVYLFGYFFTRFYTRGS